MAIRKTRLPSQYQQVEYIESSGTQYIDTGVAPLLEDKLYIKAKANSLPNGAGMIFGSYGANGFGIQNYYDTVRIYGANGWTNTNISSTTDFVLTTDTQTYVNGTDFNNKVANETNGKNYFIFGGNYNDSPYLLSTGCRFYICVIARANGTLVRNFVPCYRKTDSVIGLYDTVNGVFYTNAGSGDFTKGSDIGPQEIRHIYKGSTKVIKSYKGTNLIFADVPSTFQRVEYIESSGTQYINTGITPSLSTDALKVIMKYATTTDTFTNNDNMMFGSGTPSNNDCCYFVDATRNKNLYVRYYNDTASTTESSFFNTYSSGTLVLDSNGLSVDGSTPVTTGTSGSTSNDLPIYIFARNGTTTLNSSFKLYSFKMIKNGTLVRYFLPCYRIADNEIGLYDVINGVFYTNAGTGTFTKGANI